MSVAPEIARNRAVNENPTETSAKRLTFDNAANDFQVAVHRRVDEFFRTSGRRRRDCPEMYLKTAVCVTAFVLCYVLLVFVADAWWQAIPLSVLLGLSAAAIGFNVQHDGGHESYSNHPWVNKLMATSLDVIGGSSYMWRGKHVVYHHTYVNIAGHDTDIDLGGIGRLSPQQKRLPFHRWQHFYLWPLYGLIAVRWQLYGDFMSIITGRVRTHRYPRPKGVRLVVFIAGKATFLALAFGIPLLVHSVGAVLALYGITALVLGLALSVTFQLAHCVEDARFVPAAPSGRMDSTWAVHQVHATVDFARRNRVLAWLLGGLNFQIEHHLFPRVCHVNYPALSSLVEETCREYGLQYAEHRSVWTGVAAHYRWLRQMGAASVSA